MPLAVGNNFQNDWFKEVNGDGIITYSQDGHLATCTSSVEDVNPNRSYLRKYIQVRGGELLRLRVLCRVTSGNGRLAIDFPNRGNPVVFKTLNSVDHGNWQEHEIVTRIGDSAFQENDSVSVVVGTTLSIGGTMEIARVNVDMESGSNGALRTHAAGAITITKDGGGVVSVTRNDNRFNSGIISLVNNNTSIRLNLEKRNDTEGFTDARHAPLSFATLNTTLPGLSVYTSGFNNGTGELDLTLSDSSGLFDTSTASMPNNSTIIIYFEVRAL